MHTHATTNEPANEPTIIVGVVVSSLTLLSLLLGAFLAFQHNEITALRNAKPAPISRTEHLVNVGILGLSCPKNNGASITICTEIKSGCEYELKQLGDTLFYVPRQNAQTGEVCPTY